jgi:hypothetical protein
MEKCSQRVDKPKVQTTPILPAYEVRKRRKCGPYKQIFIIKGEMKF